MNIGACSVCGGRVTVPDTWLGIYPPVPTVPDMCQLWRDSQVGIRSNNKNGSG